MDLKEATEKWEEYFFGPREIIETIMVDRNQHYYVRVDGKWVPTTSRVYRNGKWIDIVYRNGKWMN